ncbi:MAG TPA: MoaD/ThiS family protein [bacterium]|nr:MoaD/ThiS family protein [bacterium]HPN30262.1 MoaD/ThiS family protein [bacterium]
MKKIQITIHFTTLVDVKNIKSGDTIEISDETTMSGLLSILGIIERHQKYIVIMRNGEKSNLSAKLKNNDEIKLFLPVGGG